VPPRFSLEQIRNPEVSQNPQYFDASFNGAALGTPPSKRTDIIQSDGSLKFSSPFTAQSGSTTEQSRPMALPSELPAPGETSIVQPDGCLKFDSPFPEQAGMTAEQFQPVLDKAKSVTFTTEAENKKSGEVPDFILGADGKITRNPAKKEPNKDGSLTIEVQSSNNLNSMLRK